ncbi:MAG: glutathione S-transferase family protein [Sphingomonas sp.]|nr:glutathione S-transferase family protein [Sphingomonas sp.]
MPVEPAADVEITAFRWVPPFAAGLVRDLRIRWALEEIERPYRVRLLDAMNPRPHDYFAEQPSVRCPRIATATSSFSRLASVDLFHKGEGWTEERRPQVVDSIRARLALLADALGNKDWLEGRFTIGDLMMASVLRNLRHTDLVEEQPRLAAFLERSTARPAFERALADQLAIFAEHQPEGAAA